MVIDRMSDDAVGAIMVGHEIGNELGLRTLSNEIMFLGVVSRPERCGDTLNKYGVKYPLAKRSAIKYLEKQGWRPDESTTAAGEKKANKEPLPFSNEAKSTLTLAAKLADYLLSTSVNSEHVMLALFAYNFGNPIADREVTGAREVMLGTEGVVSSLRVIENDEGDKVRKKFMAYDFCEEVIREIKRPYQPQDSQQQQQSGANEVEPMVVGGGAGSTTNTLDEVGVDMTQMAVEGAFDPVYGRNNEIRMALRTLGRRRKNNPCLIGDPGVGKTAIAEAVAQVLASSYEENTGLLSKIKMPEIQVPDVAEGLSKLNPFRNRQKEQEEQEAVAAQQAQDEELAELVENDDAATNYTLPPCPRALAGFRLVSIDLASLVAGTRNRGDFEEKVQKLVKEAAAADNVILFVDEIHNLLGTGGEGAMNAANLLKPALARGDLRMMGATTSTEYRRYFSKDAALERRFQPLEVKEPTVEETLLILKTVVKNYATYHGVEYTDNALIAAAKLSNRYVADRFLPDKAIDLIDEAGSMMKMTVVIDDDNNNRDKQSNDDDNDLVEEIDYFVTEDDVAVVVSELTGIPVGRLDTGEKERLRRLELDMGERVKGQDQAVREVAKAVRRARSGLADAGRPTCSFMFAGPTGVGKTELTKALAQLYYGGGDAASEDRHMVRIDMSEYMDRFSTTRLIGSPPGYVGYDEGGQLTEAVRRKPHSVVLFDEIEKAHEDVLNVMLQLLDEGQLTDGKGRTVSFKSTIVVMTTNLGSQEMQATAAARDGLAEEERAAARNEVARQAMADALKPELRNRIDKFVYFNTLSYENIEEIAINILDGTVTRAKQDQDLRLVVGDRLVAAVAREAFTVSEEYGARPVRRAAQRYLDDTLAEAIMNEFIDPGDEVTVDVLTEEEAKTFKQTRSLGNNKNNNNNDNIDAPLVKITKVDVTGTKDSMTIPVELQGDMTSSARQNLEWQAAYGDLPDLEEDDDDNDDDSDNLESETESFQ